MSVKITIVDYGMGNLRSVQKAFEISGCMAGLTSSAADIESSDALVVPGVGAFGDCMANLERLKVKEAIRKFILSGRPYLGICLGLQILFEASSENGDTKGLGIFPGRVVRFKGGVKIPHMGWNTVEITRPCPLFKGLTGDTYLYFVHSYYPEPKDKGIIAAMTDYGGKFASAVWKDNVIATQFHPEKSQAAGLKLIRNFIDFVESVKC
jgi:glutamine amidotransferase